MESAIETGQRTQDDKRSGQLNMFAASPPRPARVPADGIVAARR